MKRYALSTGLEFPLPRYAAGDANDEAKPATSIDKGERPSMAETARMIVRTRNMGRSKSRRRFLETLQPSRYAVVARSH